MSENRKKDRLFKAVMLAGMLIVMLLFIYTAVNIQKVSVNPCKVCMEKVPQMQCFLMVEGTLEPADMPDWILQSGKGE